MIDYNNAGWKPEKYCTVLSKKETVGLTAAATEISDRKCHNFHSTDQTPVEKLEECNRRVRRSILVSPSTFISENSERIHDNSKVIKFTSCTSSSINLRNVGKIPTDICFISWHPFKFIAPPTFA